MAAIDRLAPTLHRTRRLALATCLLALCLAATPSVLRGQPTPPPLRIGVSLGLSGQFANLGDMQSKGYRLWESHVNEHGGLLGRKVELTIRDDRSDPDIARKIYTEFIQRDELDFVFAPYSSLITQAVAPLTEQGGYPLLAAGASSEEIWRQGYRQVFAVLPSAERFSVGFLALLAEAQLKRVAVVSVDDIFSLGVAEGAKRWAPRYGLRITDFAVEPKNNPDLERAVERSRRSGAQALLVSGHFEEAVKVRAILKRIGWSPAAFYASVGPSLQQYYEQLGADAHGTFTTSLWEPRDDLRYPGVPAFVAAFRARYGAAPAYQAAIAYAAGEVLAQAITRAGSTARGHVARTLSDLDTQTIIGRFAVDRTGRQIRQMAMITQWQGAQREIVWPPEVKTAPPVLNKVPQ